MCFQDQIILTGFSLIPLELDLQEEVKFPWFLYVTKSLKHNIVNNLCI